jgi:hypothetical protein
VLNAHLVPAPSILCGYYGIRANRIISVFASTVVISAIRILRVAIRNICIIWDIRDSGIFIRETRGGGEGGGGVLGIQGY